MKKVHITLSGGQTTPIYQGICYAKPDFIVFVCSKESIGRVNTVKKALPKDIPSTVMLFDATDFQKIEKDVSSCLKEYGSEVVTINLSGGTKPWMFYFVRYFSSVPSSEFIYVEQNSVVKSFKDNSTVSIPLDIDIQLTLCGARLTSYHLLNEYGNDDFKVINSIKKLRRFDIGELHLLSREMALHNNKVTIHTKRGSFLVWNRNEKCFNIHLVNGSGATLDLILQSKHAWNLLLNTGWFEVETAQILRGWKRCREIRLNCTFSPETNDGPSNEIDIIVNTGVKLLFVECKTQIHAPTDIDKFNSVVKSNGGNGSKALFITYEQMHKEIKEKCDKYGILTFSMKEKHPGSTSASNALISFLEQNLNSYNL